MQVTPTTCQHELIIEVQMIRMYGVFIGVELMCSFNLFTEAYAFAVKLREKNQDPKIYQLQEITNW